MPGQGPRRVSRFDDGECDCPYEYGCESSCRRFEFWQANVRRAIKGRRGQAFLDDFEAALKSLPLPRLIAGTICVDGEVCAIGAYAAYKKVRAGQAASMAEAIYRLGEEYPGWRDADGHAHSGEFGDENDYGQDQETADLGASLGMARVLAYEVAENNDEWWDGTPEDRWLQAMEWIQHHRKAVPA